MKELNIIFNSLNIYVKVKIIFAGIFPPDKWKITFKIQNKIKYISYTFLNIFDKEYIIKRL
ncbi:hypothetical protein AUP43_14855 [Oceanibaculum pacificum]|uniref:Uncharacterized protein n=1 Tax=Oceanibaculum pacificum TaxID=580166 RepID=A0A154VA66_9PROT|nr:hypothetical protein AUP43_14855 [Oceanibaculum pacificum]